MSGFNIAERRTLRSGQMIARQKQNAGTGELYWVDCKLSWGHIYYSCGAGWHRTAKAARIAADTVRSECACGDPDCMGPVFGMCDTAHASATKKSTCRN